MIHQNAPQGFCCPCKKSTPLNLKTQLYLCGLPQSSQASVSKFSLVKVAWIIITEIEEKSFDKKIICFWIIDFWKCYMIIIL